MKVSKECFTKEEEDWNEYFVIFLFNGDADNPNDPKNTIISIDVQRFSSLSSSVIAHLKFFIRVLLKSFHGCRGEVD